MHWRTFVDWIFLILGFFQSLFLLLKYRPVVIFCKGGYVCVPMALAAVLFRKPIILHESDSVSGLANRILMKCAKIVCTGFPLEGSSKYVFTGNPIRSDFLEVSEADQNRGYELTGFSHERSTILVMGGSQGALYINQQVQEVLPQLVESHQVVHITGPGKGVDFSHHSYCQFEYLQDELKYIYAIADLAISRAGANSLADLAHFRIPSIIIPLPSAANNHQLLNAQFFAKRGAVIILEQEKVAAVDFQQTIESLINDQNRLSDMKNALQQLSIPDAATKIVDSILEPMQKRK